MTDTRGERVYISAPRLRFLLHQLRALARGGTAPRIMYDSTNLFAIPLSAPMVASYVTGFPQSPAAWARFAGKPEVKIVQRPGVYHEGDVLDVESGAAGVGDVHPFIAGRKSDGYYRPTIYCSLFNVPNVRAASGHFRLGVDYDLWVAQWTGAPHEGYPGAAATQYASTQAYDLSAVYDHQWPHRKAPGPPPPPPPPPPHHEPELREGDKGDAVKLLQHKLNDKLQSAEPPFHVLAIDGVFGPLTLDAVKRFQHLHGLVVDGIVGPHTWEALLK